MISVSHLVKRYGSHLAVDDVSFEVDKGEVVGFLGPERRRQEHHAPHPRRVPRQNGGTVTGRRLRRGRGELRGPHAHRLHARGRPALPRDARQRVPHLPRRAEGRRAQESAARQVDAGHGEGQRRRSRHDAHRQPLQGLHASASGWPMRSSPIPPLLILDEPTAGLDPNQIREVRDVIKRARARSTRSLLSTHILSEVESTCTRVLVIAKGKLVAQGKTPDIRKLRRSPGLACAPRGDVRRRREDRSRARGRLRR